ncbi:MAG: rod shape-determining protein MreC [Acidimicrobiia bacterium]
MASISALTLNFRDSAIVTGLRSASDRVVSPLADGARSLTRPISDTWDGIFDYNDVRAENEALRQQIEEMQGEVATARALNDQLDQILAVNRLDPLWLGQPGVVAEVVDGTPSNFDGTVELNRGSSHGVVRDDIVVTGAGLLGRIVEVSDSRSRVMLITDPRSTIQVSLPEVPDVGRAKGKGDGKPLDIAGIDVDPDHPVKVGYIVKTSGERSLAPPEIPVGTVTEVVISPGSLSTQVKAEPAADFGHLRFVKILATAQR